MFHFVSCRLADTLYTTMRLLAVLCLKVFKTAKTDEYGAAVIADNWHDTEAESEKVTMASGWETICAVDSGGIYPKTLKLGCQLFGVHRRNFLKSALSRRWRCFCFTIGRGVFVPFILLAAAGWVFLLRLAVI